jgi:hypothetical protein
MSMLTCPFVPDTIPIAIGGVVQSNTPTQLLAAFPGNTKTPTASFSMHFQGHTLSFTRNVPFVTTPALLAALVAMSAPIV